MGIVTSTESRAQQRTVYMPPEESGMAHRSYLSPDRKQVLLVEMKFSRWLPCRLTPFDGSSPGNPVGPAPAQCTDAAWSPDGSRPEATDQLYGGAPPVAARVCE